MSSIVKSLIWMGLAAGALFFGLKLQKDREVRALEEEYTNLTAQGKGLSQEIKLARAKMEISQGESTAGSDYQAQHNASMVKIAEEQKKVSELLAKWPALDTDRAAAVKEVREKETTKPPVNITLADGTAMENMVVRSVPDENTVSVEHTSGLVKIPADKLPADLKERLGMGWSPAPPAELDFDRQGNAVFKQAIRQATEKEAADQTAKELGQTPTDTTTMSGLTKALAGAEAQLVKTKQAFDLERANIRKLEIFKSNLTAPGTSKTYATLKKEANARLAGLAGRLQVLQGEVSNLKHKIKTF